jgi:antibiotic biosynthesis monooxygenase (ABM) superfamily enzyme
MVKHIVMWNLKGQTPPERRAAALDLKQRFERLQGVVPGLLKLEVGLDTSGVDYACDVVLYTEFDNEASLKAYATHPDHLAIRQELGDVRTARYQVDYSPEAA